MFRSYYLCEEYADDDSCEVYGNSKVPDTTDGLTCVACGEGKETTDGKNCYTKIADCKEYNDQGKCITCNGKIPNSDKSGCEACPDGKETKDGKVCYTKITDCAEYATDGKCTKCTGKIPKSDGTACEACPDGKETKDGKTCVDKTSTSSSSSLVQFSIISLLFLFSIL